MLDLRRLRLLHELHARGTIAAVADALQFTPSAVSQQLAVLEREAGLALLEPAGRGVRLTDAAVVLVRHADALLERAELAQADLAAASGRVAGRGRIASFQSAAFHLAVPAMRVLAREAPDLRCELIEAEPEQSLPALALGDVDLVLADEWQHQALARPAGVDREDLRREPVHLVLPEDHPAARRHGHQVPLVELAGEAWTTGHRETAWEEITKRTCRELGRFDPDIRHRTNDSVTSLALVAGGQAVTLLPALVDPDPETHPGIAVRAIAEGSVHRTIFTATRTADAKRPSVQALRGAVRQAAASLGWPAGAS
ncbi:MAG: LysR family transcriptional regulator [Solirubrobacterales bacterium]|nr:LysR family transcriptional regulator [Solirubrobacterales bacterium]